MTRVTTLLAFIALSACAAAQPTPDVEKMYIQASALTKLTSAVQAYVRYDEPPAELSEAEILKNATKHDQTLLAPFSPYKLRVKVQARQASVLMCTAEGARGLLEDVGCTARLDKHVWQSLVAEPCEFSLNAEKICAQD